VDPESRGDVHEGFDFGVPCTSIYAPNFARTNEDVNVWPERLGEGFKKSIMTYYNAVTTLGRKLAQIFALSLNLEETYFDKYITLPAAIARILYYPPQSGEIDMKELGIGAHRWVPSARMTNQQ
jgi:isopenicillin N synthase-like dioxygenase